jgi:hypothetical protein
VDRVNQEIQELLNNLNDTIARIDAEVRAYKIKQRRNGAANTWFRAILAVLGVGAPALVTYQTQVEGEPLLVLLTIGLTALAGAAANLQAIFRWGERYTRAMLTALNLEELSSNTKAAMQEILAVDDPIHRMHELRGLNEDAGKILRRTIRKDIQAEAELVTQDASPAQPQIDTARTPDAVDAPPTQARRPQRRLLENDTGFER